MATAKKKTAAKSAVKKAPAKAGKRPAVSGAKAAGAAPAASGEKAKLLAQLAGALGIPAAEVELRALRELAGALAAKNGAKSEAKSDAKARPEAAAADKPKAKSTGTGLPQRLYLLMAGRGLDGGGMPIEVIDTPCILGSSKRSTVWVNQPQIETRHLQIYESDGGWTLEDLGSEHGTFRGDERVTRRAIEHGDEFLLAGYLRMRTELR